MNFDVLSVADRIIVREAFRAGADEPFFPDWEFHALFGLERREVRFIADAWPTLSAQAQDVVLAVNNSLSTLLGYPHRSNDEWSKWISVDQQLLRDRFRRLAGSGLM
jgi:hypothetical protein